MTAAARLLTTLENRTARCKADLDAAETPLDQLGATMSWLRSIASAAAEPKFGMGQLADMVVKRATVALTACAEDLTADITEQLQKPAPAPGGTPR